MMRLRFSKLSSWCWYPAGCRGACAQGYTVGVHCYEEGRSRLVKASLKVSYIHQHR